MVNYNQAQGWQNPTMANWQQPATQNPNLKTRYANPSTPTPQAAPQQSHSPSFDNKTGYLNLGGTNYWAGDYNKNKNTQANVNNAAANYLGINNNPTPQPKPPTLAQEITQGKYNPPSNSGTNSNNSNISVYPPGSTTPLSLNPSTQEGIELLKNVLAIGGGFNPAISLSGMGEYGSQLKQLNPYMNFGGFGNPMMGMYGGFGNQFSLNPYGAMFGGMGGFNPYIGFGSQFGNSFGGYFQ